jgi:hypothetical protein
MLVMLVSLLPDLNFKLLVVVLIECGVIHMFSGQQGALCEQI